MERQEILCNP